jgi:hypothetical protein
MKPQTNRSYFGWAIVPFLFTGICLAQMPQPEGLQKKMQQMQEAAAQNERQLHMYQWMESVTLTINGSQKPPKQSMVRFGQDGSLLKTPLGPPPQPPQARGGPLRKMIMEKKIEEFEQETAEIRALTAQYLPMNNQAFQQALHTRRIDFEHNGPDGNAIVIHDYAKPGDELRIAINPATMHMQRIVVRSYFESPQDPYTASVDFSSLADGTTYPGLTTVNAPAKKISLSTVNANFSRSVY